MRYPPSGPPPVKREMILPISGDCSFRTLLVLVVQKKGNLWEKPPSNYHTGPLFGDPAKHGFQKGRFTCTANSSSSIITINTVLP